MEALSEQAEQMAKEPWQMTQEEYGEKVRGKAGQMMTTPPTKKGWGKLQHLKSKETASQERGVWLNPRHQRRITG